MGKKATREEVQQTRATVVAARAFTQSQRKAARQHGSTCEGSKHKQKPINTHIHSHAQAHTHSLGQHSLYKAAALVRCSRIDARWRDSKRIATFDQRHVN